MTDQTQILLWIDLETTDATTDAQLLELYAAWTYEDSPLSIVNAYNALSAASITAPMPPEVEEMHTTSGLLADIKDNWVPLIGPEEWTRNVLMHLFLENRRIIREHNAQVTLAGSGIAHFDVPWLRAHSYGDRLVSDCTYWLLDVGILRRTLRTTGILLPARDKPKAHRAKADVFDHVHEFVAIQETISDLVSDTQPKK